LQRQLKKTKMCSQLRKGFCRFGDTCSYAHCASELQIMPNLMGTKLCKNYVQNGICDNPKCGFAHGDVELRTTKVFFKTVLCTWHENGTCRGGDQCRFAHGTRDLRASPQGVHPEDDDGVAIHGVAIQGADKDEQITKETSEHHGGEHGGRVIWGSPALVAAQACTALVGAQASHASFGGSTMDTLPPCNDMSVPQFENIWETTEIVRPGGSSTGSVSSGGPSDESHLSQPMYLNAPSGTHQLLAGLPVFGTTIPADIVSSTNVSQQFAQRYGWPQQGSTGRLRNHHQRPLAVEARRPLRDPPGRVDLGVTHDQMSYADARRLFSKNHFLTNDESLHEAQCFDQSFDERDLAFQRMASQNEFWTMHGEAFSGNGPHSGMHAPVNVTPPGNFLPSDRQVAPTEMLAALSLAIEASRRRLQNYINVLEVARGQGHSVHNAERYMPASVPYLAPPMLMPGDLARAQHGSLYSRDVPMKLPYNGFMDDPMAVFSPNSNNMQHVVAGRTYRGH